MWARHVKLPAEQRELGRIATTSFLDLSLAGSLLSVMRAHELN